MKTFAGIQSNLEMEKERLKTFSSSNTALVAKENRPISNKNRSRQYKKTPSPYQKNGPKSSTAKKHKTKGNGEKNIARVKCYNCGKKLKKDHFAWDCLEPPKVPFFSYTLELYVCSNALIANSLPNWIINTRVSKHIVRDQDDIVDFDRYSVGSQIVVMGNGREEDVLGVGTYKLRLR